MGITFFPTLAAFRAFRLRVRPGLDLGHKGFGPVDIFKCNRPIHEGLEMFDTIK
jgi:hypothetical protein